MNIELNSSSATKATLSINIQHADYAELVEKKTKEYGKKIAIKGFRPGKAPVSFVKKMYGTSIKYEEINEIIASNVSKYLETNKINLLRDPIPNTSMDNINLDKDDDYRFDFDIYIVPAFEAPLEFKVNAYEVTVSDEILDEKIKEITVNLSTTIDKETVEEGDFFSGELKKLGADEESFKTGAMLNKLSEEGKKFFLGKEKNSKVTFDIKQLFGDDVNSLRLFTGVDEEKAASLEGEYEFEIKNISGKQPAELDSNLFNRVFPGENIETLEQFKVRYAEILKNHAKGAAQTIQKRELEKLLQESVDVKISDEYLETLNLQNEDSPSMERMREFLKEEKIVEKYFDLLKPKVDPQEFHEYLLDIYTMRTGMSSSYFSLPDWAQKVVKEQVNKLYAKENENTLRYHNFAFIKELMLDELLKRQKDFNNVTVDYNELIAKLEA